MTTRLRILIVVAILLGATTLLPESDSAPVALTDSHTHVESELTDRQVQIEFEHTDRPAADAAEQKLFAPISWAPPPPPPPRPVVVAAPKPTAPPLPFRYLGRSSGTDGTRVFLAHRDVPLAVREGDTIANQYHVERVDENAIAFVYLPLNEPQLLPIGTAQQ